MSTDKQATLAALEAEKRARQLGISPDVAQWLGWLWRPDINIRHPTVMAEDGTNLTPSRQEPASLTPGRRERSTPPPRSTEARTPSEPTEWLRFTVTTRDPVDGDAGQVIEAEWGIAGDELTVRDLEDGAILARHKLKAGEDARRVARSLLRGRSPRTNVIQFPKMGVA